jgi:hypothetical protein
VENSTTDRQNKSASDLKVRAYQPRHHHQTIPNPQPPQSIGRKRKTDNEIHDFITDPHPRRKSNDSAKVHARKGEERKISKEDIDHSEGKKGGSSLLRVRRTRPANEKTWSVFMRRNRTGGV